MSGAFGERFKPMTGELASVSWRRGEASGSLDLRESRGADSKLRGSKRVSTVGGGSVVKGTHRETFGGHVGGGLRGVYGSLIVDDGGEGGDGWWEVEWDATTMEAL